jgi:fatty acid-binding protein DegV
VRTRRRARERLLELGRGLHEAGARNWMVQHIQAPEAAEQLVADAGAVFGNDPLLVSEIGPVIGAHVGPGLLGLGATGGESLG